MEIYIYIYLKVEYEKRIRKEEYCCQCTWVEAERRVDRMEEQEWRRCEVQCT